MNHTVMTIAAVVFEDCAGSFGKCIVDKQTLAAVRFRTTSCRFTHHDHNQKTSTNTSKKVL
jgi:hypothetical protein